MKVKENKSENVESKKDKVDEGMVESPFFYWYCLVFTGRPIGDNRKATGHIYRGFSQKEVNLPMINDSRGQAGMSESSVLSSCVYLGYMTQNGFEGKS